MIIDYTRRIMHECTSAGDGYAAAVVNIEALREFRINSIFSNSYVGPESRAVQVDLRCPHGHWRNRPQKPDREGTTQETCEE